uniref:Uncharacterized protein n=1 Tax=viral metagenome TaxID=1070528 RepID=A0A6C0I168_9ZZZZ
MEESNMMYAELDMKSKATTKLPKCTSDNKEVQIEEIAKTAKAIWKKIIEYYLKNNNSEELLNNLQSEYNEFFLSFPLVLRWMVEMKQFKIKVFKAYLDKFINAEINSKTEFLKLQGDYLVMLFADLNPSISKEKLAQYEEEITNYLLVEDETFKNMEEEAKEEIQQETEKMSKEKKEALYNLILKKKAMQQQNNK